MIVRIFYDEASPYFQILGQAPTGFMRELFEALGDIISSKNMKEREIVSPNGEIGFEYYEE